MRTIVIRTFGKRIRPARPGMPMIDVSKVTNPHGKFKNETGLDRKLQQYLLKNEQFCELLAQAEEMLVTHNEIQVCCMYGHHRSVALAELLAERVASAETEVKVMHLELGIDTDH